jgi:hypothetical protein
LIYFRALVVGIAAGLLAAVLWVLGWLLLPLYVESVQTGSGGIGAVSVDSGSSLLVALIGFVIGSYWTIRRARRRR